MNLTSHALVGAAVAQVFPDYPLIAFWGAFGSHFVMDMVPHFDFTLFSETMDGDDELSRRMPFGWPFIKDIMRIGLDFLLGFALSWYIFAPTDNYHLILLLWCAFAAMLPDALQFAYIKIRRGWLLHLQRFHIFMHGRQTAGLQLTGLLSEVLTITFIILLIKIYIL